MKLTIHKSTSALVGYDRQGNEIKGSKRTLVEKAQDNIHSNKITLQNAKGKVKGLTRDLAKAKKQGKSTARLESSLKTAEKALTKAENRKKELQQKLTEARAKQKVSKQIEAINKKIETLKTKAADWKDKGKNGNASDKKKAVLNGSKIRTQIKAHRDTIKGLRLEIRNIGK